LIILEYDSLPSPGRESIFDHEPLEYAPVFEKLPQEFVALIPTDWLASVHMTVAFRVRMQMVSAELEI